ncbi:hypothetical protein RUM43_009992 [Polyplax serrata]|uniref:Ig-like domain-containing protein n=1 Tax=Polyplax serrata TaxID=468196 RepID=A0AAN8PK58_POLSC
MGEKSTSVLLLVAIEFCILMPLEVMSCPTACACKWKGGKQTVECPDKGLITIPSGIDAGTQVLEFSGNNLKLLPRERFERMGLLNLQRIYLSRCKILQIDDRAFRGLTNLVELDLSMNFLSTVPTETFVDYPSLMRLIVSGNPIRALQTASFRPLSFLTSLELSNCQIESIEDGTFVGLDNLEWLKLDGNRLNFIHGENILPDAIHGVALDRNPWQCDCRLLEVHNWLLNYKIPHSSEPKCAGPTRLVGEPIRNLEVGDLACLPDVSPTTLYLEIAEGKNISLLCRVSAVPEASVSWWFQGKILQNDTTLAPGFHFYYFVEEGREEKRSELFIFNTNPEDNGTFVCAAENPAGKSLSNYTIRIIVKEEPVVGLIVFSREYLIAIFAVLTVSCFIILVVLAFLLVRCRKQRRKKKKKERSKEIAAQNRKPLLTNEMMTPPSDMTKANGTVVLTGRSEVSVFTSKPATGDGETQSVPPGVYIAAPQNMFLTDQNPDLINGTESAGNNVQINESQMDGQNISIVTNPYDATRYIQRGNCDIFLKQHHTADIHLSPGRFFDGEGYPIDYGLPKVPLMVAIPPDQQMKYYRTLPNKRPAKMSAANPHQRFVREAEFLSHSSGYDYAPSNIRYTIEGYPCNQPPLYPPPSECDGAFIPSPPAAYKTDVPMLPSCETNNHWQTVNSNCAPQANLHPYKVVDQCAVSAQTTLSSDSKDCKEQTLSKEANSGLLPIRKIQPALTESPDEGYGGDTTESGDI